MEKLEKIFEQKGFVEKDIESGFNPSYEIITESFGVNAYSVDCCRCNPQRC